MTKPKKGRPPGAGYDRYLADIADHIVASGNKKDLSIAMRELFPLNFEFHVTRDAALRRIREKWEERGPELLAEAFQRASDREWAAVKRKVDLLQIEEANELLRLSKVKVSPISESSEIALTMFMPPATPAGYTANPFVQAAMSYGEYQQGYKRRYIEQKRKEQREAAT